MLIFEDKVRIKPNDSLNNGQIKIQAYTILYCTPSQHFYIYKLQKQTQQTKFSFHQKPHIPTSIFYNLWKASLLNNQDLCSCFWIIFAFQKSFHLQIKNLKLNKRCWNITNIDLYKSQKALNKQIDKHRFFKKTIHPESKKLLPAHGILLAYFAQPADNTYSITSYFGQPLGSRDEQISLYDYQRGKHSKMISLKLIFHMKRAAIQYQTPHIKKVTKRSTKQAIMDTDQNINLQKSYSYLTDRQGVRNESLQIVFVVRNKPAILQQLILKLFIYNQDIYIKAAQAITKQLLSPITQQHSTAILKQAL